MATYDRLAQAHTVAVKRAVDAGQVAHRATHAHRAAVTGGVQGDRVAQLASTAVAAKAAWTAACRVADQANVAASAANPNRTAGR